MEAIPSVALPSQRSLSRECQILPIRHYPDPILNQVGAPVVFSPEIQQLAADMLLTMAIEKGLGLAAPQVGRSLQMFCVDIEHREIGLENSQSYLFINPVILSRSGTVTSVEGCLSFGLQRWELERARSIVISATDLEGNEFTLEAEGLLAVVIQHEYDHCQGKTFVDHMGPATRKLMAKSVRKDLRRKGILT